MAASRNKPDTDLESVVAGMLATTLAGATRLAVGLSGGCDSIVLLNVLVRLRLPIQLSAIHVHHGLSPNADAWAEFCRATCQRLDVDFQLKHAVVNAASGSGLEAAAREARYKALADSPAEVLLLAHHRGDQAETLLFNLMRGAGVSGLAAMRSERLHNQLRIVRPLLGVGRAAIEGYAQQHQLRWIEDESNSDRRFSRNFIRHEVMPLLNSRFPAADRSIARAADYCAEADSLLSEVAAEDWLRVQDGETARLPDLVAMTPARLKNLLRYRLRQLGWRVPVSDQLEEFVRQLKSAGPDRHPTLSLSEGTLQVRQRKLHWLVQK
jgi:tRNA(Ile)-lysidine synthase